MPRLGSVLLPTDGSFDSSGAFIFSSMGCAALCRGLGSLGPAAAIAALPISLCMPAFIDLQTQGVFFLQP